MKSYIKTSANLAFPLPSATSIMHLVASQSRIRFFKGKMASDYLFLRENIVSFSDMQTQSEQLQVG